MKFLSQVIGSLQCVQDALFHITSRLRETIIPTKPHHPNFDGPPYASAYPDMPPPMFRPRHNPASPSPCPSPVGLPHGIDHSAVPSQLLDHPHPFSHGMDHNTPSHIDRAPYPYGSERSGHGRTYDRPSSPRMWNPQVGVLCFFKKCVIYGRNLTCYKILIFHVLFLRWYFYRGLAVELPGELEIMVQALLQERDLREGDFFFIY